MLEGGLCHAVDADPMEYSQPSQSCERSNMNPPSTSSAGEEYGGPRKLVRTRQPSPPCARNVFVDGPEDSSDLSKIPRRPPFVSRYRCAEAFLPVILLLQLLCTSTGCPVTQCSCVGCCQAGVQGDDHPGAGQFQQGVPSAQQI